MKIVIIGGGTTGVAVATKLRRRIEDAEIVILEKSQEFAIAKCGLPYLLSGKIKEKNDLLAATPEQMQRIFKVKVKLEHEVIKINRKNKKLLIQNQRAESYDKLIIATGAIQLRPDIHGVLGENIFTVNSMQSLERLKNYYYENKVRKVLVIGANAVGLAFAEALHQLKANVLITDFAEHILPSFDADMTLKLEQTLKDKGIDFCPKSKITAFKNDIVHFKNGESCRYDMVVIATGKTPDLKLAIMANIEIGSAGGIKINKYMQTNDRDVYACGKISEMINVDTNLPERTNNPATIAKQARVVANHIAGIRTPLFGFRNCEIIKIADYSAGICGISEEKLQEIGQEYQKVVLRQFNQSLFYPTPTPIYMKLLFADDGLILGGQIIGKQGVEERINALSVQMQHNAKVKDLMFEDVAYHPSISQPKDIINNIGALAEEVRLNRLKYKDVRTLEPDTFVIDVCNPNEFVKNGLDNAINLPLTAIRDNLKTIPRNRDITIYCNSGYGAYLAYQILKQNDFDKLYLLES